MPAQAPQDEPFGTQAPARSPLTKWLAGLTTHTSLAQGPSRILGRNANPIITMEPTLGEGALGLITNGDVLIAGARDAIQAPRAPA